MEIIELPIRHRRQVETSITPPDLPTFSAALYEAAELLEASQASDDEELRKASVDLAVRALNAAGAFLYRQERAAK